jgi:hypothetical protein
MEKITSSLIASPGASFNSSYGIVLRNPTMILQHTICATLTQRLNPIYWFSWKGLSIDQTPNPKFDPSFYHTSSREFEGLPTLEDP